MASQTGKATSHKKANAAAETYPAGSDATQAATAYAAIVAGLEKLSPIQMVQIRSILDMKLVPSGLVLQLERRRAIGAITGGVPEIASGHVHFVYQGGGDWRWEDSNLPKAEERLQHDVPRRVMDPLNPACFDCVPLACPVLASFSTSFSFSTYAFPFQILCLNGTRFLPSWHKFLWLIAATYMLVFSGVSSLLQICS